MSTEEYNRKVEQTKKLITMVRKDLRYREDQQKRGQTTYILDAQIKGSFTQLDDLVIRLQEIFNNFKSNPRDFGLSNKNLQDRQKQFNQLSGERVNLKRTFDTFFEKKKENSLMGEDVKKEKQDYGAMNSAQLHDNKKKLEENQEQMLEETIEVIKRTKQGQKGISDELKVHDKLINEVEDGMDDNIKNMGKVRRNMVKLLEESSNCCLVSVIVLEIAAILLIIFLWN